MSENEFIHLKPERITMTPIEFDWFVAKLDEEPKDMPKLRALMGRPSVWDEVPC